MSLVEVDVDEHPPRRLRKITRLSFLSNNTHPILLALRWGLCVLRSPSRRLLWPEVTCNEGGSSMKASHGPAQMTRHALRLAAACCLFTGEVVTLLPENAKDGLALSFSACGGETRQVVFLATPRRITRPPKLREQRGSRAGSVSSGRRRRERRGCHRDGAHREGHRGRGGRLT